MRNVQTKEKPRWGALSQGSPEQRSGLSYPKRRKQKSPEGAHYLRAVPSNARDCYTRNAGCRTYSANKRKAPKGRFNSGQLTATRWAVVRNAQTNEKPQRGVLTQGSPEQRSGLSYAKRRKQKSPEGAHYLRAAHRNAVGCRASSA